VNKASHLLLGATAGTLTAAHLGAPLAAGAAIGAVAGLAPDIDHPGSTLGRRLPRVYHALTPGHRGPTHTVEWCALLAWAVAHLASLAGAPPWWAATVGWLVFAGACSHLAADLVTEQGIPGTVLLVILYKVRAAPWWARTGRVRVPRWLAIRTGGAAEPIVAGVVVLAGLVTLVGWWAPLLAWVGDRLG
jgi:inner membrane protein